MKLLGLRMQQAGLSFISARATHHGGDDGVLAIDEVVCATKEDCAKVQAWAEKEGLVVTSLRVATAEEMAVSEALS